MMRKSILWKDAFQTITHSLGRYIAIILLIGLGTFAFVGLKMAGPDMRATGADFFTKHNLADVTVTSNYGSIQPTEQLLKIRPQLSRLPLVICKMQRLNLTKMFYGYSLNQILFQAMN
nr:hypothetical protein [Lactobacillus helveticus]